jgi:two-component system NtrC family response regulator
VRLEGERGTGKNLAARFLHRLWRGPAAPFVEVNIAAISAGPGREQGELVGWRRGAFTGAVQDLPGLLELANDGTAFLNEIGIASLTVQWLLLRLLDEPAVTRLGEHRDRRLNLRLITATNENLEAAVHRGAFREDLFDRLGLVTVRMPSLRDRLEDVPALAARIMRQKAAAVGVAPCELGPIELGRLMTYRWPGNVRELEGTIEYILTFGQLPKRLTRGGRTRGWRADLEKCVAAHHGNMSAAARELGVARSTLYEARRRHPRDRPPKVSGSKRRGRNSDTPEHE